MDDSLAPHHSHKVQRQLAQVSAPIETPLHNRKHETSLRTRHISLNDTKRVEINI
jgi:hypothetical protein